VSSPIKGFLDDDPTGELTAFLDACREHVIPFVAEWWTGGGPIPTAGEVNDLRASIQSRAESQPLEYPYAELPALLEALASNLRFNRRNFVNIHPSPFLPSVLASMATAIQNPNNIVEEVSPATWDMEKECVRWLAKNLFGIDEDKAWGNIVSGGTLANMTALLVARDYAYDKLSRPRRGRVGPRGVIGMTPGVVLATAGSHYSLEKALWFLGIGSENVLRVPVCFDEQVRSTSPKEERFIKGIQKGEWKDRIAQAIDEDEIKGRKELDAFYSGEHSPFELQPLGSEILKTMYSCFEFNVPLIACVLTLGTTDTGTIERLDNWAIRTLRDEDVYIHVDAASGGFAFMCQAVAPKLASLADADSFTVDGHKSGLLHYPCGAVVFKDKGFLQQIYHEAPYLGPLAPTIEGSRSGSGVTALWYALRTLKANGYVEAISHLLGFTKSLSEAIVASDNYQVLHAVDLNALAIAPKPVSGETRQQVNSLVRQVRQMIVDDGEFLVNLDRHLSGVKVKNVPCDASDQSPLIDIEALRIVITNPLVRQEDAHRLTEKLEEFLLRARRSA
jgi:glutamate/tyrosine decarboxylase-like PLP-dependent enzyme